MGKPTLIKYIIQDILLEIIKEKKKKKLIILLVFLPISLHAITVSDMRDSLIKYKVHELEISLAMVIFETGLDSQGFLIKRNNYFAFRGGGDYIKFSSCSTSIVSYRHWQERNWIPFKMRNLGLNYYDYLLQSNYAPKMNYYVGKLKQIIKLYKLN